MSVPVLTIVRHVLGGVQIYAPAEQVKAVDAQAVVDALNGVLDDWNADVQASVCEVYTPFVTTPSLNPHTIGPTGTWVLPVRPVAIDGLAWVDASGFYTPITVHSDPGWWLGQFVTNPGLLSDAYYNPTEPDGSLYFTGLPASGTSVVLMTRSTRGAVTLTASLSLAAGYQSALELTTMEAIAESFGATVSPKLERRAGIARGRIFSNNLRVPSLSAAGLGLPGTMGSRRWDTRSGTWI